MLETGRRADFQVGHHGCQGSSTPAFLRTLSPKICVFTTGVYDHNAETRKSIRVLCAPQMYFTVRENGVLAYIGDGGEICCRGQLHEKETAI